MTAKGTIGSRRPLPMRAWLVLAASLAAAPAARALVITEIMYNPPGADDDLEFIELYNERPTPEDLSGCRFTAGVHYEFPRDIGADDLPVALLEPHDHLVLAADRAAFVARYGFEPFGVYEGKLANEGERIVLENDMGDPEEEEGVHEVLRVKGTRLISLRYNDRGEWPTEAYGTGHSLCLVDPLGDPRDPGNWVPSPTLGGSPGAPNGFADEWIDTAIFSDDPALRYRKGTSDPPASWADRTYDDGSWSSGRAPIGYDDNDQYRLRTDLTDMRGGYVTFYVRIPFEVDDPSAIDDLVLQVSYDDGFVAYLNGEEVARANLSAPNPDRNTTADSAGETPGLVPFDITGFKGRLVEGENVVAIELHNGSLSGSSDALLDARLASRRLLRGRSGDEALVINEGYYSKPAGRYIEIYNRSGASIDLADYYLSTSPDVLDALALSGTIPGRGFRAFGEAFELPLDLQFPDRPDPEGPPETGTLRVFLSYVDPVDPAASHVVSAKTFDGDVAEGSSTSRYPDGSDTWCELSRPTRGAANEPAPGDLVSDVVINEIMYHPFREDDPFTDEDDGLYGDDLEYVELYNRGDAPIDLTGFRFTKGIDFTFPDGTRIEPRGYLVIANNPARIEEVYGITGVLGPFQNDTFLADDGELIRLKDDRGNTADEVHYHDGGHWDKWADGLGSSLELVDPRQDNASPTAWKASDESGKSSWFRVAYSGTHGIFRGGENEFHIFLMGKGEVLIDDLKFSPNASLSPNIIRGGDFESPSSYNYWIKSNDRGGTHIDSHWTDEDAHAGGGCLKLVASGRGDTAFNRLEQDTTQSLQSGRTYHVEYWARWLRGVNLIMTRTHGYGVAQASAIPVPERLGTPGARNSVYQENQGPVFEDLRQRPVVPGAGESANVTVRVSDADGVVAVFLRHRDDRDPSFARVAMADDGAHGDGEAGDGVYGATIPGYPNGTLVEFYVEATDSAGAETEFPPDIPSDAPATVLADRALYRVGDRAVATSLFVYRIIMSHEVQAELDRRRNFSNHLVPGTFILGEDKIFYNIGFRFRGSPFIRRGGNGGYAWSGLRVRFPADRRLFGSLDELNLDGSGATNQHDRTAYYMERKVGASVPGLKIPFSRGRYVMLRFKAGDREHTGTYDHVQKIDNDYLGFWWRGNDKGQLHKVDDWFEFNDSGGFGNWQAAMTYFGADENRYRDQFKVRSLEKADDFGPLIRLCDALTNWSDARIDAEIRSIMDVREWVGILSVRFYIDDWDTLGIHRGKNAYIYLPPRADPPLDAPPGDGRWKLIPWDSDLTFGNRSAVIYPGGEFPQLGRLFRRPWVRRWLHADYYYIIEELVQTGQLGAWLRAVATSAGVGGTEIDGWCRNRAQTILGQIPDDSRTPFRIDAPEGDPYMTDETSITIRGRAPYHADVIRLNGERIDDRLRWTDNDGLRWAYDVELLKGSQTFTFEGFDRAGALAGRATLEVVGLSEPPPKILAIDPSEGISVGGAPVTIEGSRFEAGAKVYFGESEASEVEFVSSEEIHAVTPPHVPGEVLVTVENPTGVRGSFRGFLYLPEPPPEVTYIHPDRGHVAGGTRVQIRGTYLQPGLRVYFGSTEVTDFERLSEEEIAAVAPPHAAGRVPVRVVNPDTQSSRIDGFTYLADPAPEIASVGPREGSRAGGVWVTIRGAGFQDGAQVWFGSNVSPWIEFRSATEIRAFSPAADPGASWVSLYVENPDGQYAWIAQGHRYLPAGKARRTGDANGDGRVDIADVVRILEHLFQGRRLDSPPTADFNADGRVDVADAVALAYAMAGRPAGG